MVLTKTKEPVIEEHVREVEPVNVKRSLAGVERVWLAIESGVFYPAPSTMNCASCGYREACRAWMGLWTELKRAAGVVEKHLGRFFLGISCCGGGSEWFTQVCQDLPNRPWLDDERDQPDVATTPRALQRKLLPHAGHEFGPRDPGGVVRAGVLSRVTAGSRGVTIAPMSAGRSLAPLADVPDGQRRDGGPERVIRRKDAVIPVPVLARRRHEVGEPVEKLKRREVNDAVGPWSRGLVPAPKAVLRDSE